jgi:hypothetical protein
MATLLYETHTAWAIQNSAVANNYGRAPPPGASWGQWVAQVLRICMLLYRAGSRGGSGGANPPFPKYFYVHDIVVTQHAAVLWLDNKPQAKCTILSYVSLALYLAAP